ncbi:La [Amphibalanus amphitrite]|uniref:La n=1 Tax=Amphibalanus amphitrite TaxID=1232801 RepID=A0A6A4VCB1_AMPAM|nr:la protein homolog [Amphibalanus amphitrite]KAF0289164.1 La [Amphibalanus amphitrite]
MADVAEKTDASKEEVDAKVKADEPAADSAGDGKEESESNADAKQENGTPSNLEQKIIRQIEYYFGDYNLPKDKFLQEEIKKDDGWVSLDTMLNFQRLKNLTTDKDVITGALLKSTAKLMEVSEDGSKLRRNPEKPLPELSDARKQEIISRSVYIKGFPKENTTLDMLLEFLKDFGKTDNVQMRNYHDKVEDKWKFKGSIFATFPSKEEAEAFIKLESVKHGDEELIRKWQADYLEEKKIEMKEGKRGKEKRKQNLKEAAGDDKDAEKNGDDKKDEEKEEKVEHVLGAVLVLKGLKETTKWTSIKDRLVELGGDVAFVDFSPGDPEAYARLKAAGSAKDVFAKMEGGKVEIDGAEVEARVLEGEEEVKYLDDQHEARKNLRSQFKRKGSQRGRGRGRGRGAKRGRF